MKLQLPNVTLFCFDCVNASRAVKVIEHCKSLVDFGAVKYLTSLPINYPHETVAEIRGATQVEGLVGYSCFMLTELGKYCPTSHMLTVQHDGWIVNPTSWEPSFLQYDYIGPLFVQDYGANGLVGSGGFSLRSRKLMDTVLCILPEFANGLWGKTGYAFEDGLICIGLRQQLEALGIRFAPSAVAARFAYGGNQAHYCDKPFGFHGFYALDTLLGGNGDATPRNPDNTVKLYDPTEYDFR
jgi:hypothetical protein